jgi:hypothetical protein
VLRFNYRVVEVSRGGGSYGERLRGIKHSAIDFTDYESFVDLKATINS